MEKAFPRGGSKPTLQGVKNKRPQSFNIFAQPKKIKRNQIEQVVSVPKLDPYELQNTDVINQSNIKDGFTVIGCIVQVKNDCVVFSIPGSISGVVFMNCMPEYLIQALQESNEDVSLTDYFKEGSYFTVKVLTHQLKKVFLSLDPKEINSQLTHKTFTKGYTCTGSVKSEEEHGYVIDFGVSNLSSFLNHNETGGRKLLVGELVKCVVLKSTCTDFHTNIQVSCEISKIKNSSISSNEKFSDFQPGLQFQVKILKILKSGLKVSYLNNKIGYVNEKYLVNYLDTPKDYKIGDTHNATLLFILPTVNILFFTLRELKPKKWKFNIGNKISSEIVKITPSGLYFNLTKKSQTKCFVPVSKIPKPPTLVSDADVLGRYKVGSKQRMRIVYLDVMGGQYIASMDKSLIAIKHYTLSDVQIGEILSCNIQEIKETGLSVSLSSTLMGYVAVEHTSDQHVTHIEKKFTVGQKVKTRVLAVDVPTRRIYLTMKPQLLALEESEMLMSYDQAQKGQTYLAVVVKVYDSGVLLKYFNNITGFAKKIHTPYHGSDTLIGNYYVGQLLKTYILSVNPNEERMSVSLLDMSNMKPAGKQNFEDLKIGTKYAVKIMNKTSDSLIVQCDTVDGEKCIGTIPQTHLSGHARLAKLALTTFNLGQTLEAVYCQNTSRKNNTPVFSIHPVIMKSFEVGAANNLNKIKPNKIVPFSIQYVDPVKNRIFLNNLNGGYNGFSFIVHEEYLSDTPGTKANQLGLLINQVVMGKIIDINTTYKSIKVSLKVSECWDHHYESSLEHLHDLIKDNIYLKESIQSPITKYHIGQMVNGIVSSVTDSEVKLELKSSNVTAIVPIELSKANIHIGDRVDAVVVWIDYNRNLVHATIKYSNKVKINRDFPTEKCLKYMKCRILFTCQDAIVGVLKGLGRLVYIPNRVHMNDFAPPAPVYQLGEVYNVYVKIFEPDIPLAIDSLIHKAHGKRKRAARKRRAESAESPSQINIVKSPPVKKKKIKEVEEVKVLDLHKKSKKTKIKEMEQQEEPDDDDVIVESAVIKNGLCDIEIKSEIRTDSEVEEADNSMSYCYDDISVKSEAESDTGDVGNDEKLECSSSSDSEEELTDDGPKGLNVGFNWNAANNPTAIAKTIQKNDSESSSSDEEEDTSDGKSKKPLTKKEKLAKAREEEENIRKIEETLMNRDRDPQTADDFDRLVMFEPDNSQLWIKYMTLHLQGTEIEKARAVARKALKTISFRLEQEKLNVWLALLNLENLYGNEESINMVIDEALQLNDPYKIHQQVLNLYVESYKVKEVEKLGNAMLRKYKDVLDAWPVVGCAYMKIGKIESARNVLQRALGTVPKKEHVGLIIKFAQLENKFGNEERAQTLYEQILNTFPKRVDVWSCYVDMLIKSERIELARQVLERATSQTLPPRKMKTLFKKYLKFEEEHGTPEQVGKVRQAAVEYVNDVVGSDDE